MTTWKSTQLQSQPVIKYRKSTSSYPNSPPQNAYEHFIAILDKQSFSLHLFVHVDNILMSTFFKTKRCYNSYRALSPAMAFIGDEVGATSQELLSIAEIICSGTRKPFSCTQDLVDAMAWKFLLLKVCGGVRTLVLISCGLAVRSKDQFEGIFQLISK